MYTAVLPLGSSIWSYENLAASMETKQVKFLAMIGYVRCKLHMGRNGSTVRSTKPDLLGGSDPNTKGVFLNTMPCDHSLPVIGISVLAEVKIFHRCNPDALCVLLQLLLPPRCGRGTIFSSHHSASILESIIYCKLYLHAIYACIKHTDTNGNASFAVFEYVTRLLQDLIATVLLLCINLSLCSFRPFALASSFSQMPIG